MLVDLNRRCEHVLEKEVLRLRTQYGIEVTPDEIVQALIEQHRLKLRVAADAENASAVLEWLWRRREHEAE